MTRATYWRVLMLWYLLDFAVIACVILWFYQHPPESTTVVQGAFRCDHSWRLPCD
jgi:hypothetical protein